MHISWWAAWLAIAKALAGVGIPESRIQNSDTFSTLGLDTGEKWSEFWLLLRRVLSEDGCDLPEEAINGPPKGTVFKFPDQIVALISSVDREYPEKDATGAARSSLHEPIKIESKPTAGAQEPDRKDGAEPSPRSLDRWGGVSQPQQESGIGVQVFYATDRAHSNRKPRRGEAQTFGSNRSAQGKLSFGTCLVTMPLRHRTGMLERPSIFRLELHEDSHRHVILKEVNEADQQSFFGSVAQRVAESSSEQAFVFIHGYNVTFAEAACRTAQLAYDLNFDGAPIFYSWPSHGTIVAYPWDEANVEWTIPHLQAFLDGLVTLTGTHVVHVIAHSMGNRALVQALRGLVLERRVEPGRFHHAILAAPDIDAEVFCALADSMTKAASRVTLYFSPNDKALQASKIFHGQVRVGESLFVLPGVDTIDASAVDTSLLGHSYVAASRSVLSDIFQLVSSNTEPSKRFAMRTLQSPRGTYYAFQP